MATVATDRYISLDVVRGFAVLGILVMNITALGLPGYAYVDPSYYGGDKGWNLVAWLVAYALADGKLRALFTMLFGASLLLITDRAEASTETAAKVHYNRMFWLLVIGLLHGWLLWYGDILYSYAILGSAAFLFRRFPPCALIGLGLICLLALSVLNALDGAKLNVLRREATQPNALPAAVAAWNDAVDDESVPKFVAKYEIEGYRGGFVDVLKERAPNTLRFETEMFLEEAVLDGLGFMLLGMALFRTGFLTGERSLKVYRVIAGTGFGVAIPLSFFLGIWVASQEFDVAALRLSTAGSLILQPVIALAYASALILAIRAKLCSSVLVRLAAAGRMALSNYIGTSILATTLFYGYGFGLFGHLERAQLYVVVVGIWLAILLWSKPWLKHFEFGPLEWTWRSLARRRVQPFRKSQRATPAVA